MPLKLVAEATGLPTLVAEPERDRPGSGSRTLGALDYFQRLLETFYSLDVTFTPALQAPLAVLGLRLPGGPLRGHFA